MGYASRALFAAEVYSLDTHLVAWKVELNIRPAIGLFNETFALMRSAAGKLRTVASAAEGKGKAQGPSVKAASGLPGKAGALLQRVHSAHAVRKGSGKAAAVPRPQQ